MKLRIAYLGMLAGLGLWIFFVREQNQFLSQGIARLQARLEDFAQLQNENVRLKAVIAHQDASDDELERLRREARDVLRLRNEVTSLRNVRRENQRLTTETYELSNQLQQAVQIANEWRNYQWTTRAGTQSNGPTEFVPPAGPGDVWPELTSGQLTGTGPSSSMQPSEAARLLLEAPVPGNSAAPGQGNNSMPADHARFSNQDCSSCHPGLKPQGRIDSGTMETLQTFFSRR